MTTDDRDIEPANPSKSFKVGDFDRLSGFFTPVWESKRKIRSESPIPSSSAAAGVGSGKTPPASRASRPSSVPPAAPERSARGSAPEPASRPAAEPASAPPEPTRQVVGGQEPGAGSSGAGEARASAAPAISSRPLIPMPRASQRLGGRAKPATKAPSAASIALRQAGPNLGPEAFLDREPDFRSPLPQPAPPQLASPQPASPQLTSPQRKEQANVHLRSLKASAAATAVHEKLKSKLQLDSVETRARQRATESERDAVLALEARADTQSADPYPLHLLRRLRRTLHVSVPVPESVRSLLGKYRRN